jgi:hypothetical protein
MEWKRIHIVQRMSFELHISGTTYSKYDAREPLV